MTQQIENKIREQGHRTYDKHKRNRLGNGDFDSVYEVRRDDVPDAMVHAYKHESCLYCNRPFCTPGVKMSFEIDADDCPKWDIICKDCNAAKGPRNKVDHLEYLRLLPINPDKAKAWRKSKTAEAYLRSPEYYYRHQKWAKQVKANDPYLEYLREESSQLDLFPACMIALKAGS